MKEQQHDTTRDCRWRRLQPRQPEGHTAVILILTLLLSISNTLAQCSAWDKNGKVIQLDSPSLPQGILYDAELGKITCQGDYSCSGFTITGCWTVICNGKHSCEKAHLPHNWEVSCAADYACHLVLAMQGHDFRCGDNGAKQSCKHAAFETDAHVYCVYKGACDQDSWEDRLHVSVGNTGRVFCLTNDQDMQQQQQQPNKNNKGVTQHTLWPCRNLLIEVPTGYRACFSRQSSSNEELYRCGVYCHPEFETSCDFQQVKFLHQPLPH
ncbi:hypothetical protein ACA910_011226 [Epithemia clementina (nom. ined.)]